MPRPLPHALLAALALSGCLHDVHVAGPVAAAGAPREPAVRVLVFGDFGSETLLQALVARAMRAETRGRPYDLAVQVGDNIYPCGPEPSLPGAEACRFEPDGVTVAPGASLPDDPRFQRNEGALRGLRGRDGGPLPMFLALGNHDTYSAGGCGADGLTEAEAARRRACLEVARRTPTWTMPGRRYVLDRGPLRLVVVDTNVVVEDYGGFTLDDEVAFVREATAGCGAGRTCFLVGHHPPAAVHHYRVKRSRQPTTTQRRMARLLEAAGVPGPGAAGPGGGRVRGIFAGHVHMLEHLSLDGLDVFISGSTAMGGYHPLEVQVPARAQVRFATDAWGFATLEAGSDWYRVAFTDHTGTARYCCEAGPEGPCRAVACGR